MVAPYLSEERKEFTMMNLILTMVVVMVVGTVGLILANCNCELIVNNTVVVKAFFPWTFNKKVKEYKESLEAKAEEALNNAIEDKAKSIAGKIMEEEELMVLYTEIARDEDANLQWRLKAMDSLSKYLFGLDKKSIEVDANIQQVIFSGEDEFNDEEEDE